MRQFSNNSLQGVVQTLMLFLGERTDSSGHNDLAGNNVGDGAAVDGADRNQSRVNGVKILADQMVKS